MPKLHLKFQDSLMYIFSFFSNENISWYDLISIFSRLLPHIKGNVGFVFTKDDLSDVRSKILENRVSYWAVLTIDPTKCYPFIVVLCICFNSATFMPPPYGEMKACFCSECVLCSIVGVCVCVTLVCVTFRCDKFSWEWDVGWLILERVRAYTFCRLAAPKGLLDI